MTIQELYTKLIDLGVSEDRFYLCGLYGSNNDEEKHSLIIRKGTISKEYEVYFKERGEKNSIRVFLNEDQACNYLYDRLTKNKEIEDIYIRKNI